MGSSWGLSWGRSWGNSWGSIAVPTRVVSAGGRGSRRRTVWLEEDGEILVFRNSADAAAYLASQKHYTSATAKTKARKIPKPIRIDVKSANAYLAHIGRPESVYRMIETDWAFLSTLLRKIEEWEEDERLILLLVA